MIIKKLEIIKIKNVYRGNQRDFLHKIIGISFTQKTDFEQMTLKTEEIRGSFHMANNLDKRVISQEITPILAK